MSTAIHSRLRAKLDEIAGGDAMRCFIELATSSIEIFSWCADSIADFLT
jgi:hypothetical protein